MNDKHLDESKKIDRLQKALNSLNKKNSSSENFEHFNIADFPVEFESLVKTINETIEVGSARIDQKKDDEKYVNALLEGLSSDFIAIYLFNLEDGTYKIFKNSTKIRKEILQIAESNDDFNDALLKYIENFVEDEDKDYLWQMAKMEHVREELKKNNRYAVRYRVKSNSNGLRNFVIYFAATGSNTATVAFKNIDYIVYQEEESKQKSLKEIEDTLSGANIGLWTIEVEYGCEPRMIADDTMLKLVAAEKHFTPEEVYKSWYSRVDENYLDAVNNVVAEMRATGKGEVSYPWYHPIKGKMYVRCGGIPVPNFNKKGFAVKGYHQDITEIMEVQVRQGQELKEALIEAKKANQIKTEFLSHMSHDIRTPINGILGMLTIAEDNENDLEKQRECRKKIRNAAEHLLSLINDVLDISKLESGAFTYESEKFTIYDIIESCNNIFAPQAEEAGVFLEMKFGKIEHPNLEASSLHLRQILINLISNSVKYNKKGGKILVLTEEISSENQNAIYQFTVKDTGIGMSEDFLKILFEPFTQENSGARTTYKGTGLGMSITKKLVEGMNGTIQVQSELGVGSQFTVTIPLKINNEKTQKNDEKEIQADIKGMNILLVDDNEMNLEIAEYILKNAGANIKIATDGQSALDEFSKSSENEYDCILMDVMMPVMNGLEATQKIRNLNRADAKTIPIFALSANAFAEDAQKAKDAGMTDSLAKPLDTKKLLQLISAHRRK